MTADTTYNGWSNYSTWNVNLWLSNEEALYNMVSALAESARNTGDLADSIEDLILNRCLKFDKGCNLGEVNFVEIAEGWSS